MRLQFLFAYMILIFYACSNPGDNRLYGDWGIIEFTIYQAGYNSKSTEKMLRDGGAVWDLKFTGSGKFQQDFNMSDREKTMHTQKGTWKAVGDSLKLTLDFDSTSTVLNYTYKVNNDILTLDLENPANKNKVISKFRKK